MTRPLSSTFSTHLAGLTQEIVELFKISAVGMSTFLYTDSKESVTYEGWTFDPYPIKRSKITFSTDLRVDQTVVTIAKNWGIDTAITKNIFSGSRVFITRVKKDTPDTDNLLLFDGEIADTSLNEREVVARCQTLDFLNVQIPKREIEVQCNWKLYDRFCTVGLTLFQSTGSFDQDALLGKTLVSSVFAGQTNNYYRQGFIKITSSDNNELKRYVASHVGQTIIVIPNFPYQIFDTDTFEVVPGCKHDLDDCENKFDNLVNYGGFPFTPRQDEIA